MRLKIFITPLAFSIAVVVAIWYIWPAVMDIRLKTDEVKNSQENLNSTLTKKSNVEILTSSLDKSKDKEEFILNFLPSLKDEEKIVNGLNYLAGDSGVNLANVSITDEKISISDSSQAVDSAPVDALQTVIGITPPEIPAVKFSVVKVDVFGKYENIKIFLGQIHKMEIINRISLLSISKDTGNNTEGDMLRANVEIKFGHVPYINQAGNSLPSVFSRGSFNFDSYSKINELIARKIPILDVGQREKPIRFFPN